MLNLKKQTYRRLAEAMQQAMSIPEGNALVFIIGKGNENSNLEALETVSALKSASFKPTYTASH